MFGDGAKIIDDLGEAFFEGNAGLPVQGLLGQTNIRLTAKRIILRHGLILDLGTGTGQLDDKLGHGLDTSLIWITQVYRAGEIFTIHQAYQAIPQ